MVDVRHGVDVMYFEVWSFLPLWILHCNVVVCMYVCMYIRTYVSCTSLAIQTPDLDARSYSTTLVL